LTITAQAERAAAMWPNKGEKDQRPEQGQGYHRIQPTRPQHPVVPEGAPGDLRLPLIEIRAKATNASRASGTGVA
jgi:cholesterol oxidase